MQAPYSRTMFDLLREQAERAPDHPIALTLTSQATYAEVAARAARIAGGLHARGLRRGSRVGLLSTNSIEWLEVFFAACAIGATVIPLSTWSTAHELGYLLSDATVDALFTIGASGDRDFAADLVALRDGGDKYVPKTLVLMEATPRPGFEALSVYRDADPLDERPPGIRGTPTDTMAILYTSGSSNRPKAVPLEHYAVIENGFNIGERQGLRKSDRVLISIPLFWSYGVSNALPAVVSHGATMVLQDRFAAAGALDLIEKHGCTGIYTLPAMTNALVAHPAFKPGRTKTLRTGVTIGSPQDVIKAVEALGASELCNIYGSTETYGNCCVTRHDWPLSERATTQGHPLPGVTVRIRNAETGELCAPGSVGEVEIKGYLTRGYAGESARHNAEVFTADGYFKSGDLGSLTGDGRFSFAGRSSEMIKRSGINVSPAEVEEVLQQHPAIGLAGVTGVADASKGEIIVAFVVAKPGAVVDTENVTAHCREKLSRYKVPDRIEIRDALPLTPTGKLMRRELKAIASRR